MKKIAWRAGPCHALYNTYHSEGFHLFCRFITHSKDDMLLQSGTQELVSAVSSSH